MPSSHAGNTVCIIGAGVAGLTAGADLARHGFQVKVLEASARPGGCCGSTMVDRYLFTDGAQYLIYPRILDIVFSQLGVDRAKLLPLRRVATPQTTYLPNGMAVTIGNDYHVAVDGGKLDVARAQDELRAMAAKWEAVGRILEEEEILLKPFSPWRLFSRAWRQLPKFGRSLDGELRALFSDPYFRSAIAAHVLYAGAPLSQLPSVAIVALVSALVDGMALPPGGMGNIPEALAKALVQYGGELLLNERVTNICVQNGHVNGVQTEAHGVISCERVISTASAMTTYETLIDPAVQPRDMVRKVRRTRLSPRAFCVQLGTAGKLPVDSHLNYVVPMMDELGGYFAPAHDRADCGYYSVPTVAAPELAPTGASIIEYFPVIRQRDSLDDWSDDRVRRLGDAAIQWLQDRFGMTIAARRVRGPREFRDQLSLYDGAVYGVSAAAGVAALFPQQSPIGGLYLAGQTTYPGLGVPTAALSGIHAANLLMKTAGRAP